MSATLELARFDLLPPPTVIALLARRSSQLQMMPDVAFDAMQLSKNPNCSIGQYSAIVERDIKLTVDILKIANSALYSPPTPISNLHQAVVRLGLRECQNLIFSSCIRSLMHRISLDEEMIRVILWQHSFTTGLIATHLNRTFHFGFEGEEFTAGLIHDLGRTLLAVVDCAQFTEVDSLDFDESPNQLFLERTVTGTDHCRLGAWYAIQQQLPRQMAEVMLWHHNPAMASESQHLTALVAVADHMANHLQRTQQSAGYDPQKNPFVSVLAQFCDLKFEKQFAHMATNIMDAAYRDAETMARF